jgi:hypothetical protein
MTFAPSPDNIILGKGELFFDRFVGSASSGSYFHLGNCSRFAIVTEDDVIEINSSMDAAAGLIKRVTRSRRTSLQITSNEHGIENLALALMGDTGTLTQTSSAIAGEILTTSVIKGRFYKTAGRQLSAVVVNQGTATWTQSTDYVVYDAGAGIIQVKATTGTAVTTATTATISYTRASLSLDTVLGATKTKIEGKLLFVPDPTTGPQFDVEVYHVGVQPDGEVGLISEDFGEYSLNLAVFDDSGAGYGGSAASPFYRLIQRGTA